MAAGLQASEGQLLQSLRREIESIEQRLDEERAAHTATRKASGGGLGGRWEGWAL
jgi:hypothetical protein